MASKHSQRLKLFLSGRFIGELIVQPQLKVIGGHSFLNSSESRIYPTLLTIEASKSIRPLNNDIF
jgi:hypothetical protein